MRIERLVFQGDGLGRLEDGRVVFVPLSAAQDLLEVRLLPGRGDFARGEAAALLEASPIRAQPACRYFGTCGGCQWQHLTHEGQVAWKAEILRELLVRVGKLSDVPVEPPLNPLPPWGYRARAQLKLSGGSDPRAGGGRRGSRGPIADGRQESGSALRIGFHRRESHQVVDVEECPLLHPTLNALLRGLRGMRAPMLSQLFPGLREVWMAVGAGTGEAMVALFAHVRERAALRLLFHRLRESVPSLQGVVLLEGESRQQPRFVDRHGHGAILEQVGKHRFRVDATAFFQVSSLAAETLTALVAEAAALTGKERVLDLYCGVGTFTIPLARLAGEVVGIESHPSASADALYNVRVNDAGNVRILQAQVEQLLPDLAGESWDLAVLDPPRQGASRRVLEALGQLGVPRIVYVSCDPSTLARDLGLLAGVGYSCVRIQPVDLFPQTFHLEAVAVLERRAANERG
ncbi:MAG: 23S rRNA (uracil(1939)-C(5))-methyltransferase RlmD [candidate division NC10 bacterium]|nr:23S rRNA (uracil(1939)-C(5))-methyltransferase RlmD [candidate division NC10 bacterium]